MDVNQGNSTLKKRKWASYLKAVAGVAAVALIAWGIWRPDRIAHMEEVRSDVLAAAQVALPSMKAPATRIDVKYLETSLGDQFTRKQSNEVLTPVIVRKSSKRFHRANGVGVLEESSQISIGPLTLVRHYREPLPFVGDLLPQSFWTTWVLVKVQASPAPDFPKRPGSRFSAAQWFEEFYSNGGFKERILTELECVAGDRADAKSVHPSFTGFAIKVRCEDRDVPQVRQPERMRISESWYVEDLGLTFQTSLSETIKHGFDLPPIDRSTHRSIESVTVTPSQK